MDTKNVIAAISLSAAVIILYGLFFAPDPQVIKKQNSDLALKCSQSIQLKGLSPLSCLCFLIRLEKNIPKTSETILSLWTPTMILHKQLGLLLSKILPILVSKMQLVKVKEVLLYLINSPLEFTDDWIDVLNSIPPGDNELIDSLLSIIFEVSDHSKSKIIEYVRLNYSQNKLVEILHHTIKKKNIKIDSLAVNNLIKKVT